MKALRVLHVNASDLDGGAARAAHRIHVALRLRGVDSRMLVIDRRSAGDEHVVAALGGRSRFVHKVKQALSSRLAAWQHTPSNPVLHSLNIFPSGLGAWINDCDADLVNLHWVGGETLSVAEIGALQKPVCWTMHDMWPFCGAEHYDDLAQPGRFIGGYTRANRPAGHSGPDLDAWVWRRKQRAWSGRRFQLISPSLWLAGLARQSKLLAGQPCTAIPNCIDTGRFRPVPREAARQALGLPVDRKYILFGAASTADRRKGLHLLRAAIERLAGCTDLATTTELIVFGASEVQAQSFAMPVHHRGRVEDDGQLSLLYSAADVFAAPSMQDNLPNTVVEALACGTPCAAFRVGGMAELIAHAHTGWLAEPFSTDDFCDGLARILRGGFAREPCREQAIARYGMEPVGSQYERLYRAVLSGETVGSNPAAACAP